MTERLLLIDDFQQIKQDEAEMVNQNKHKSVLQVRNALICLCQYSQLSRKQRYLFQHQNMIQWLHIVSELLGFLPDVLKCIELNIPHHLILAQLARHNQMFAIQKYKNSDHLVCQKDQTNKYIILMEGIVEKQAFRYSIFKMRRISKNQVNLDKMYLNNKKNNKKIICRSQFQMPILINGKFEANRVQRLRVIFNTRSEIQVFQVNEAGWKHFIGQLPKIILNYLFNFIKKSLGINIYLCEIYDPKRQKKKIELNSDLNATELAQKQTKQNKEIQLINSNEAKLNLQRAQKELFTVQKLQKKQNLFMNNQSLYLIYLGQMLVKTSDYSVQVSKSCIANSFIVQNFHEKSKRQMDFSCQGYAKTDVIYIKINLIKLFDYFANNLQDKLKVQSLLLYLENNRKKIKFDSLLYQNFIVKQRISEKQNIRSKMQLVNKLKTKYYLNKTLKLRGNEKEQLKKQKIHMNRLKTEIPTSERYSYLKKIEPQLFNQYQINQFIQSKLNRLSNRKVRQSHYYSLKDELSVKVERKNMQINSDIFRQLKKKNYNHQDHQVSQNSQKNFEKIDFLLQKIYNSRFRKKINKQLQIIQNLQTDEKSSKCLNRFIDCSKYVKKKIKQIFQKSSIHEISDNYQHYFLTDPANQKQIIQKIAQMQQVHKLQPLNAKKSVMKITKDGKIRKFFICQ